MFMVYWDHTKIDFISKWLDSNGNLEKSGEIINVMVNGSIGNFLRRKNVSNINNLS